MTTAGQTTAHTAARRLRSDAARNVEKISAAAMDVFAERGLAVSMADVAERAAVGVGTVYRRFGDKTGLIDAVFAAEIQRVTRLAEDAALEPDPSAFVDYLVTIAEQLAANRGLRQLMFTDDFHPGGAHVAAMDRLMALTGVLVDNGQRAGWLRGDVSPTDVPLILMAVGAVADVTAGAHPAPWRRLLRLVVDGMRTDRSEPPPTGERY